MIDIIIVEDDYSFSESLKIMIETSQIETRILDVVDNVSKAIDSINRLKPNLVFLDIILPDGNGFDILNTVKYDQFKFVFTSSHSEYAIKAFEMSALHYLIKPLSIEMVDEVISRYDSFSESKELKNMINVAENYFNHNVDKIMLRTNGGSEVFNINDIIRITAEQNYSLVHIDKYPPLVISKNISYFENLLENSKFLRAHNSHLININHIKHFYKGRPQKITMSDGFEIRISDAKRAYIIEKLGESIIIV